MNDYKRDKRTGALIFFNPEKEKEILAKRSMAEEIAHLKNEINTLKKQVQELLSKRN